MIMQAVLVHLDKAFRLDPDPTHCRVVRLLYATLCQSVNREITVSVVFVAARPKSAQTKPGFPGYPTMTPDELRSARRALKLTQAKLAAEFGVSQGTVYEMEKGLRPIRRMIELAIDTLQRQAAIDTTQTIDRPITPAKIDTRDNAATKPVQNPPQPNPLAPPIRYI